MNHAFKIQPTGRIWYYTAENVDRNEPATADELREIKWPQPQHRDEYMFTGPIPPEIDDFIYGEYVELVIARTMGNGETIRIEITNE